MREAESESVYVYVSVSFLSVMLKISTKAEVSLLNFVLQVSVSKVLCACGNPRLAEFVNLHTAVYNDCEYSLCAGT